MTDEPISKDHTNQAGEVEREAAKRLRAGIDGLYTKRNVSFSAQDWADIDAVVNAALATQPATSQEEDLREVCAARLIDQSDEPDFMNGNYSERMNYWRDKAIYVARRLRGEPE